MMTFVPEAITQTPCGPVVRPLDLTREGVQVQVLSDAVLYGSDKIWSTYAYRETVVTQVASSGGPAGQTTKVSVVPRTLTYQFELTTKVPKLGLMMVGWGGNNGSTLTAALLAHQKDLTWATRRGPQRANFFGSLLQAATIPLGVDAHTRDTLYVPFTSLAPFVDPKDIVVGGWDISGMSLGDAMDRARVLEPDLIRQVKPIMDSMKPLPSVYSPEFIALNQQDRADNVIRGAKKEQLETLRRQIRTFKAENGLDKVIVLWTANTERYAEVLEGVNDTSAALLRAIEANHDEVAPSTLFGVASILEGCPFINGSPQNTFVPGLLALSLERGVACGGDDFKSGQTKIKSVLTDFLVGAGIKPLSITSYNHLGNNDGLNLSAPAQFRSKEISKSNVVDDMVASNTLLYPLLTKTPASTAAAGGSGVQQEQPDHVVVIKYVPQVGDSKRALDEYESEIFMGGRNTISMHNTCEDSLLAAPLILDLALMTELLDRVKVRLIADSLSPNGVRLEGCLPPKELDRVPFESLHPTCSLLSYWLKAPVVQPGRPLVNALFKQRNALEDFLRAVLSLPPVSDLDLPSRTLHLPL